MRNGFIPLLLAAMGVVGGSIPVMSQDDIIPTSTYMDVPGSEPREHPIDITTMKLSVTFTPDSGIVNGRVTHDFVVLQERVDSMVFDAVKIKISQAMLNGRPARIVNTDTTVVVYCEPPLRWDTTGSVSFTYTARPRKGIYFVGWNDPTDRMRKQIWTQGQATDNRHWIPMYDELNDKMITSTEVRFDSNYVVVSNGRCTRVIGNSDSTKTWQFTMDKPHSSYLLMLAIGKYAVTQKVSKSGVPIELYSYPDRPDQIEATYKYSVESMDWLEQEIGVKYPWPIYRQVPVADFIYGAMENTTATIFGDFYMANDREWLDRSYVNTNVHELTHQWFGDMVTARSKKHHWLQESFATYYPYLYVAQWQGQDDFEWQRRRMQNEALEAGRKDRKPIVHPDAGGQRYYPKGAVVLHMMRYVFGDESMRRVIRHYLMHHAYGNVETNDLYLSFQDTLGLSPEWFFDQWLYRGGEPHFKVRWQTGASKTLQGMQNTTTVSIEQAHTTDHLTEHFRMPVVVSVHYADGEADSVTVWTDDEFVQAVIPNTDDRDVAFVLFDPGSHILKHVDFPKEWSELVAQVRGAPNMIDRYDALVELGRESGRDAELLTVLEDVMDDEPYHAMRSKAASIAFELANRGQTHAWKVIRRALEDKHVDVRKGAVRLFTVVPDDLRDELEDRLEDESYEVIGDALGRLCHSFPSRVKEYAEITAEIRSPFARVEIMRLEALATMGDTASVSLLADYASNSFEFWTRGNAMRAFKRMGLLTSAAAKSMIDGLLSANERLAGTSREVLESLLVQDRWKKLYRKVATELALTNGQRRTVGSLLK